jgi:hypothetical protein
MKASTFYNYKPICDTPQSACMSNAAGYTMCCGCKGDDLRGPAWHPTPDMLKAEATANDSKKIKVLALKPKKAGASEGR